MYKNFFATLEYALTDRHRFSNWEDAQIAMFRIVEGYFTRCEVTDTANHFERSTGQSGLFANLSKGEPATIQSI